MEDLLSRALEADADELRALRALNAWSRHRAGRTVYVFGTRIVATEYYAEPEEARSTKADCPVDLARALRLPGFAEKE